MSGPRCEDCRFACAAAAPGMFLCRRHPPQVFDRGDTGLSKFPHVAPDQWCGEFQADCLATRSLNEKLVHFGPLLTVARAIMREATGLIDPAEHPDTLKSLCRVLGELEGVADSTGFTK